MVRHVRRNARPTRRDADGFSVIGFAALDQFRNLPPENVGYRAPIAADGIGIADAFCPV